jgi:hypothetical protein
MSTGLRRLLHCAVDFLAAQAGGRAMPPSRRPIPLPIFGRPERPDCCAGLQPSPEMCGENRQQALRWLADLEVLTHPG